MKAQTMPTPTEPSPNLAAASVAGAPGRPCVSCWPRGTCRSCAARNDHGRWAPTAAEGLLFGRLLATGQDPKQAQYLARFEHRWSWRLVVAGMTAGEMEQFVRGLGFLRAREGRR